MRTTCLIALVFVGVSACAATPERVHLKASVELGALTVRVINDDHQDWNDVRVRLSDKFFCPAQPTIAASQSAIVTLGSCTSLDGARFTPATMVPTNVVVTAVLTEDTGEAIAGFAPGR